MRIASAANQQIKVLQEGLSAIRDVLLDGSQAVYLELYSQAISTAPAPEQKYFLGTFPRYVLEALGLLTIALLGGGLVLQETMVQQ